MDATFGDDRLSGLGVAMGRISRFPIDMRRRPYNTFALCDVSRPAYLPSVVHHRCFTMTTCTCIDVHSNFYYCT